MTDRELKNCPFCGSRPETVTDALDNIYVRCQQCKSQGSISMYATRAFNAWNKRDGDVEKPEIKCPHGHKFRGTCPACASEDEDDREPVEKSDKPEIGVIYNMLKAIYCQSKGDAIAANSYAVNAHEYYEQMGFDQ